MLPELALMASIASTLVENVTKWPSTSQVVQLSEESLMIRFGKSRFEVTVTGPASRPTCSPTSCWTTSKFRIGGNYRLCLAAKWWLTIIRSDHTMIDHHARDHGGAAFRKKKLRENPDFTVQKASPAIGDALARVGSSCSMDWPGGSNLRFPV